MALTGVDIYKILPKTNCGECGIPSCFTFATMVVTDKVPLSTCPYINLALAAKYQEELDRQHEAGIGVKSDVAKEALDWAKERCASMKVHDLSERIGGQLVEDGNEAVLELPYFLGAVFVRPGKVTKEDGSPLNHWEQVFIFNHMAQGGSREPTGKWISLQDIPNSAPKVQSMRSYVEQPLVERFKGKLPGLLEAAASIGGTELRDRNIAANLAILFRPLPRIPLLLLFWDEIEEEGFEAQVKLLFDETISEHLDIESITFLSERLKELLCGDHHRASLAGL